MRRLLTGMLLVLVTALAVPHTGGSPHRADRNPARTVRKRIESGFITITDGSRLYYRKVGSGAARVIAPSDLFLYDFTRRLTGVATVVTYDTRGRGRSELARGAAPPTIEQDVRDLEEVRRHFGFDKFVPVGFSYLGKAVVMYAATHPARASRLIMISAAPPAAVEDGEPVDADRLGAPARDVARMRQLRLTDAKERSPAEFCLAEWAVTRYMLVGAAANAQKIDVQRLCSLPNEWPVNADRTLSTLWESVDRANLSPAELARVTMPVLVIHGTSDRNSPYKGALRWAATLPNARLMTVLDAGHVVWADDPNAVGRAIREFISGHWPAGAEQTRE